LVHPARLIESFHHPEAAGSSGCLIQNGLAVGRQAEPNAWIALAGRRKVFANFTDRLQFFGCDVE